MTEFQAILQRLTELEDRVAQLELKVSPAAQKKHTLSILKDILSEELQDMGEDEFADEDENTVEEVTEELK